MNCVKKLINGVVKSPTSKRTLAWIVAVTLAFGGLTSTSFAEDNDPEDTEVIEISAENDEEGTAEDPVGDAGSQESSSDEGDAEDADEVTDAAGEGSEEIIIIDDEEDEVASYGFLGDVEEEEESASYASSGASNEDPVPSETDIEYTGLSVGDIKAVKELFGAEYVWPEGVIVRSAESDDADSYIVAEYVVDENGSLVLEEGEPKTKTPGSEEKTDWFIKALKAFSDKKTVTVKIGTAAAEEASLTTVKIGITVKNQTNATIMTTFKFKNSVQTLTVSDVRVTVDGAPIDSANYELTGSTSQKDSGDYKVKVHFKGDYEGLDDIELTWTIEPMGLDVELAKNRIISSNYSKTRTAKAYAASVYSQIKASLVTVKDEDGKTVALSSLSGFALRIADTTGTPLEDEAGLPVGEYGLVVDERTLDSNYKINNVVSGKVMIKGTGSGTVTLNGTSFTTGSTVKATLSSSQYTMASWVLTVGLELDSSTEVEESEEDIELSEGITLKDLEQNDTSEYYFLTVTFKEVKESLDPDAYDESIDVTKQFRVVKEAGKASVDLKSSYTYGDSIKATLKSSDYSKAVWTVSVGQTEDDATEEKSITASISSSTTVTLPTLDANSSNEYYFLTVTFTDPKSEDFDDELEVVKQFKVNKKSISGLTSVSGTISSTTTTWNSNNNYTVTVAYTTSSIAPTIKSLILDGKTLKVDEDFTVDGDTDKHTGGTSDTTYTIKLTGIDNYKDTKEIKWTIKGKSSSTASTTQLVPQLSSSGSVTAATSSRISTLMSKWKTNNPTGKKLVYTLKINSIDRTNISQAAEDIISKLNDSSVTVECYDISVNEKITDISSGSTISEKDITQFDNAIDVALTLGKASSTKDVIVIREHGGTTSEMTKLDKTPTSEDTEGYYVNGSKVTIYSRYFSNYTLVYTSSSSSSSSSGSSSRSGSGTDDSSSSGSRAPRTGDNLPIVWVWVVVLFAGVVITSFATYESLKAKKIKAQVEETKKKR